MEGYFTRVQFSIVHPFAFMTFYKVVRVEVRRAPAYNPVV